MQRIKVNPADQAARAAKEEAIAEGRTAALAGQTVGQNPHKNGIRWTGWRMGWFSAQATINQAKRGADLVNDADRGDF